MSSAKQNIQTFGRFLSSMVMPNIGAFIAWGIITALFIPTGWIPNEEFSKLVGPMITYLLPLLIGYTGGKNVYGVRGGVVGSIATAGIIVGTGIPMFIGAMIMGPLGAYLIKKFDELLDGKIYPGFEMLVNNFSAGIIGTLICLLAFKIIGPVVENATNSIGDVVAAMTKTGILPIVSIIVEPAKILFLNNAINHGVFSPLALEQVQATGKSILYLIETNPGPGLGVLLAYAAFGKGNVKLSTPSAIIIHFFGGIHEIYFPYVLMNPFLVLAVIAGGATGVFTFMILGAGLTSPPSPGSIIALLGVAAKGSHLPVLIGVTTSTIVSFLISSIFVKMSKADDSDLEKAKETSKDMKINNKEMKKPETITKIIYACDAGMGSSAMGATMLQKNLSKKGVNLFVKNYAINDIPQDASIVVSHEQLTERAKKSAPNAYHISVTDFLDMKVADIIIDLMNPSSNEILKKENIFIGLESETKEDAIKRAGQILIDEGYANKDYIDAMLKREKDVSTYIGKGVAMPHGVAEAKNSIKKSGVSILLYPNGVFFGEETAYIVIGIAGKDDEHLSIIGKLAEIIDSNTIEGIKNIASSKDKQYIYSLFKEI